MRLKFHVGLAVALVLVMLAGCSFWAQKPGHSSDALTVQLNLPGIPGARGAGTDTIVSKVFVKGFNVTTRQVYTPTGLNVSLTEPKAVELQKVGNVWKGSIQFSDYSGGSIMLVAYAVDSDGRHLYSGLGLAASGSGQVLIATQPGWQQSMVGSASNNWGPSGGYIAYFNQETSTYYELAPSQGANATWDQAMAGADAYVQGGATDWSLPDQLLILRIFQNLNLMGTPSDFGFMQDSGYWTSTEAGGDPSRAVYLLNGGLGNTIKTVAINYIPVRSIPSGSTVQEVAIGGFHTLVLKTDGTLYGTGGNNTGQLGLGNNDNKNTLQFVMSGVKAVAAGALHSLVLKEDGTVWAMGDNSAGQLGLGDTTTRTSPTQIPGLVNIVAIAAGQKQSFFLDNAGNLYAAGNNENYELGLDNTIQIIFTTPTFVTSNVAAVSAGERHTMILKVDGTLYGTGLNNYSQLGLGFSSSPQRMAQVTTISSIGSVVCGGYHTLVIKQDKTVWAVGCNDVGQLGLGFNTPDPDSVITWTQITSPPAIPGNVQKVAAGRKHTLILLDNGALYGTGDNARGQLGVNTAPQPYQLAPIQITTEVHALGIGGFSTIVPEDQMGGRHSVIIKNDHSLWAMGYNYWGQLGDGTNVDRNPPVLITGF
ncbi:MAG: hypothetical protein N2067_07270 [Spirochaetaceae bacterium]|nr:hypothetical protein [Spirochaetaceae bacterium]